MTVRLRRVYDDPSPDDGKRVLVDRLWPRGLSKEEANVDEWVKDVAPSGELRIWYGHDPAKFEDFRHRYRAELADPVRRSALDRLGELAEDGPMTLLTATRDFEHSHAAIIAELLGESGSAGKNHVEDSRRA
ncbi:DUF488 domain-containing protein [Sphaerisporangium perillae]|uniref:DUF488 domain-containing protein n=1 Tax=Sphaerisporangium perillae TaxID=2935860 RepID=UPI00200D13AB|nr:DUF488 family protein [Sphaerisporangium perillae]